MWVIFSTHPSQNAIESAPLVFRGSATQLIASAATAAGRRLRLANQGPAISAIPVTIPMDADVVQTSVLKGSVAANSTPGRAEDQPSMRTNTSTPEVTSS